MKKRRIQIMRVALLAAGMLMTHPLIAEDLVISSFENGYVSWTNIDSNLYYTVEYRPNLCDTNLTWNGSHRVTRDIKTTNRVITVPVGCFYRVVSSLEPQHINIIPRTGQTNSVQAGDDGSYQRGAEWPSSRFSIQSDTNCVMDNLTGLVWARNANLAALPWSDAISFCENLTYGGCNDWRLPNRSELDSLVDAGRTRPALPAGHPFEDVQNDIYWTSTTYVMNTDYAWTMHAYYGDLSRSSKTWGCQVWPVRGGR